MAEHHREHEEHDGHDRRRHGGEAHESEKEREHERRADGGRTMHTEMEMDRPGDKKGGPVRRARRARGGGMKESPVHVYNAVGSPEEKEAEDEAETFKRGGRRRKAGGSAMGEHSMHRADKAPRGRRAQGGAAKHEVHHHGAEHVEHHHHRAGGAEHHRRAAGGSVYSTGSKLEMKEGSTASRGHEGQAVPSEPKPG